MPAFWLRIGDYSLRATIGVIRGGQFEAQSAQAQLQDSGISELTSETGQ